MALDVSLAASELPDLLIAIVLPELLDLAASEAADVGAFVVAQNGLLELLASEQPDVAAAEAEEPETLSVFATEAADGMAMVMEGWWGPVPPSTAGSGGGGGVLHARSHT